MIDLGQYISILATILVRWFWHLPGQAMMQAAGVSGTIRDCLIFPTLCTIIRTRKYQMFQLTAFVAKTRTQCWLLLTSQCGPWGPLHDKWLCNNTEHLIPHTPSQLLQHHFLHVLYSQMFLSAHTPTVFSFHLLVRESGEPVSATAKKVEKQQSLISWRYLR